MQTLDDLPDLLTPSQARSLLKLGPSQVCNLCRAGKLPGAKLYAGIIWLIPKAAVLAYRQSARKPGRKRLRRSVAA